MHVRGASSCTVGSCFETTAPPRLGDTKHGGVKPAGRRVFSKRLYFENVS